MLERRAPMLIAAVAVSVAALAVFTSTSGFYGDDFINFRQVQVNPRLSLSYLLEPTSAHFAPGHRLGDWLLHTLAPLNFAVAQAALLVGFAASLLVLHRVLAELFPPRPALVLTFVYGASMMHVAVHQWWSSGMDRVPATLLTFVSILGYLKFHRTGSRMWLGVSVGALALALMFYVKPVFVPLYLVLLRVLLLRPDETLRQSIAGVQREWRVWLLYAVPVAAFSVVYLRAYDDAGQVQGASLATLGRYVGHLWFRVAGPGAFGIWFPQGDDSTVALVTCVAVQVAVAAAVAWSIMRRRVAWRAWLFLALTFLANAVAVGLTRIGVFGPRQVAYQLLYNLEFVYLTVLAVGFAFAGAPRARPLRAAPAFVATGLVAYAALSWWGSHRIGQPDVWPGPTAREYVQRVEAFLAGNPVTLVDGTVPEPVMFPLAGPWTSQSEVFPVIDENVSFEVGDRPLFDVATDGTAHPVRFVADAGGDMADLLRLGVIGFGQSRTEMRDGALCLDAGDDAEFFSMAVPAGAGGDRPYVLLGHSSRTRGVGAITSEPLGGGPPAPPRFLMFKGGGQHHDNVMNAPAGPMQRLYVIVPPQDTVCLSRIVVGRLQAR